MPEDGIDAAADLAVQDPYWNPRPVDRDAVRTVLADAWHGAAPQIWQQETEPDEDLVSRPGDVKGCHPAG